MRFKIDWASLIVGSKFTVFALIYFVFDGNFQVQAPRGGLYLEGLISEFYGNFLVFSTNQQCFEVDLVSRNHPPCCRSH